MEKIPSSEYPLLVRWCKDLRLDLYSKRRDFEINYFPTDSFEKTTLKLKDFYRNIKLQLEDLSNYFKITELIKERDDYCINIPSQDHRIYIFNNYNKQVIKEIEFELDLFLKKTRYFIMLNFPFVIYSDDNRERDKINLKPMEENSKDYKIIFKKVYAEFEPMPLQDNNSDLKTMELTNIKPKILVLRELGIIDLLNEKFNRNNSKIADCIGTILNEKPSSIRVILSNINGIKDNNTNPENIAALENAILVLHKLGCANEVLKLQKTLEEKQK